MSTRLCKCFCSLWLCGQERGCACAGGGPSLSSGIFLNDSFILFLKVGPLSQTQSSPALLVSLASLLMDILSLPFEAGMTGKPPCPSSICVGSGHLNSGLLAHPAKPTTESSPQPTVLLKAPLISCLLILQQYSKSGKCALCKGSHSKGQEEGRT